MDNISSTLQQSLTQLITSVVTLVGVIVLMLTISPLLTLVVLVTLPLSLARHHWYRQALADATSRASSARSGQLNGHVEEMYHRPPHREGLRPRSASPSSTSTTSTTSSMKRAGARSSSRA